MSLKDLINTGNHNNIILAFTLAKSNNTAIIGKCRPCFGLLLYVLMQHHDNHTMDWKIYRNCFLYLEYDKQILGQLVTIGFDAEVRYKNNSKRKTDRVILVNCTDFIETIFNLVTVEGDIVEYRRGLFGYRNYNSNKFIAVKTTFEKHI